MCIFAAISKPYVCTCLFAELLKAKMSGHSDWLIYIIVKYRGVCYSVFLLGRYNYVPRMSAGVLYDLDFEDIEVL